MSLPTIVMILTIIAIGLPMSTAFFMNSALRPIEAQPSMEETPIPTPMIEIGEPEGENLVSALGTVEADTTVTLSFRITGRVENIEVETGDVVRSGDVLLTLENETQRINLEQAELALARAQLELEELLAPPDDTDIRVAEANLQSAQSSYTQTSRETTDEEIQAAELRYQRAQEAHTSEIRERQMMSGNAQEIALQDAAIGETSFNMEIARLELESLRQGSPAELGEAAALIRQRELELEQVMAGATEAEITDGEIEIQRAEADVIDAEVALQRTVLRSPMDGVIFTLDAEIGQAVNADNSVITVVDSTPLWVVAQVDEIDIEQVEAGQVGYVRLDALAGVDIPAVVEEIALIGEEVDGVMYFDVRLRLESDDPRIRIGMTAEAFIPVN